MGLDMMLYEREKSNHPLVNTEEYRDIMYWRKFNALHQWFVDNCQGGVDECELSDTVTKEQLIDLLELVKISVNTRTPYLKPVGGFFFGSTEYDEYYWENCVELVEGLTKLLHEFDFGSHELFYCSSW